MSWSKLAVAAVGAMSVGVIWYGLARPTSAPEAERPSAPVVIRADDQPSPRGNQDEQARREKAMEREQKARSFDAEITDLMKSTSHLRLDLKMRLFELELRSKELQTGISEIRGTTNQTKLHSIIMEFAPEQAKDWIGNTDNVKGVLEVSAKASAALRKTQREIYESQEELRLVDELAAMRIESLKRRYAAFTMP